MRKPLSKTTLNTEQISAVRHTSGPLLIVAGAGTGKTTVITERIRWLIEKKLVKPAEILALTFTEKAAREMEERVDIALPYGVTQLWIMTFHSFGERVLRQEALHIGLDPGYRLMTEAESIMLFRKHLFDFSLSYFRPMGNPRKFIEGMLVHFSRLADEDVSPEEYLKWAKKNSIIQLTNYPFNQLSNKQEESSKEQKQLSDEEKQLEAEKYLELANTYLKWSELKVKEGVMDFGDLITNTLKIFRTRKNVLKEYQNRFKYILVDEYQDTNFAQNELAILLSGDRRNITVVGDDDQAIYRWRGAAISNIIHFKKRFPETSFVVLRKNYRSTKEILNRSYRLIQNNNPDRLEVKEKINKKLKSMRKISGEPIEFIYCSRVEEEAEEIVKRIKNLLVCARRESGIKNIDGEKQYSWKDFAILVRANNYAESFMRAMSRAGIPYQFLGPGKLFRQPEVKDLIAYLKLLTDFSDSVALFRILSMDVFGIPSRDLVAVASFSRRIGLSLFEAVETIVAYRTNDVEHWSRKKNFESYLPHLDSGTEDKIISFIAMIRKHLDRIKTDTAGQILYYFLEDTGILQQFTTVKTETEEKKILNISKFFDRLKSYEASHEDASVQTVMDWIDMMMNLGESPMAAETDWSENDAVNILTVHSAKGLEFPVVFIVNLVTSRFPTNERREMIQIPDALVKEILPEGDYHMEEERRLFYVAMTRARDRLFLSASNYYGEGKRERKLSLFVVETLGEGNLAIKPSSDRAIKQLSLLEWKKKEEPEIKKSVQPIGYLSYSQINTFLTCPLQYRYRYILRIPVPQSAAGSFGTSMHLTLQRFYEAVKKDLKPGKNDLLKLLDDVWIPLGYGNRSYEEKMKNRGREMLTNYYEKCYNPDILPISLEQVFSIRVSPNLKIGGKIDRVDQTPSGKLEIIDYKTGKKPDEKKIASNFQMTVYALAATDKGIFNKKPEDVILSFYFFDHYEKISSTRTAEQLEAARCQLIEKAKEIETSDFAPKVGPWCDFCDFKLICEAWK